MKYLLLSFIAIFIFACTNDLDNESKYDGNIERTEKINRDSSSISHSFIKYPFESGIVEYKNTIMDNNKTVTLYFIDYGKQQCIVSTSELKGEKISTRDFVKDDYYYSLIMSEKRGVKYKITEKNNQIKTNIFVLEKKYLEKIGVRKEESESVIGKECDVYSYIENGIENKIWAWGNLIIKMEAEQNKLKMLMEISRFEKTNVLPFGIFDIPSDFSITEFKGAANAVK